MDIMKWRIATSLSDLAPLPAWEVPVPDVFNYVPYSNQVAHGQGRVATYGYKTVEILWRTLDPYQMFILRDMIDTARASANHLLYMTVPLMDGTSIGPNWTDISGLPFMEAPTPGDPIAGATGFAYKNVRLQINNITIENEDPTF